MPYSVDQQSFKALRCARRLSTIPAVVLGASALLTTAHAQRAAENVIRAADDAFGASVGDEEIGLYSNENVRGFSPISAGNIRIERLTIDRQSNFSNRLIGGSTIRAGLSAQGYLLPAPTGIVDFSLRRVAETPVQSIVAQYGLYGSYNVAADLQERFFGGLLETTGGAGYEYTVSGNGSRDIRWSLGAALRLRPSDALDITVYGDYWRDVSDRRWIFYFTDGTAAPPEIDNRRDDAGQPWVERSGDNVNFGIVARYCPSIADFELGAFRSTTEYNRQIAQFFTNVAPDKTGELNAFIGPSPRFASTSFEARASRGLTEGDREHTLTFNLRGRDRDRRFGGAIDVNLGLVNVEAPGVFPEPDVVVGPSTREDVRQITAGLAYGLRWRDRGEINVGLQKTDYTRTITAPSAAPTEGKADPLLYNASAAIEITPRLVAYGGIVRGFEEGPSAPSIALNRNEAPPAIETEQADAGLRLFVGKLTAVVGVFRIEKPFFSLGTDRLFRETGTITNRGVELSLAGPVTDELQVIAGAVFFDPTLSGAPVEDGLLSADPIAFRNRTVTLNMDYRPKWAPGWSGDLSLTHLGPQNGDNLGRLTVEGQTFIDLGLRKELEIAGSTFVLRARLDNVFNTFGWMVSESGAFSFRAPRGFSISVRSDF